MLLIQSFSCNTNHKYSVKLIMLNSTQCFHADDDEDEAANDDRLTLLDFSQRGRVRERDRGQRSINQ